MVSGITPCGPECKWIVYFGETPKVREFVAIALLAFRGADRESLVAHMQRAIRLGATKEELFEVLEATLVPGGAPTFHRGLSALLEVE